MQKITLKSYKKQTGDIPKDLLKIAALVFFIWATLIIYKLGGLLWLFLIFLCSGFGIVVSLVIYLRCYWRTKNST